jgi:hypothetical protein
MCILTKKLITMTNYEQKLFTDLLDVNWMIEENKANKEMARFLNIAYHAIQSELRESMGDNEYNTFIRVGREMFAPAKG